jgi:ribose 5-phosphate isomerase A
VTGPPGDVDPLKLAAAERAAELVQDGMVLGLGTGRTAALFVAAIGRRVQSGLRVVGVATSRATELQARQLGIPLSTLDEQLRLDLTVDGADEIDPISFNLIKGAGGALLREKLIATASAREVIVADQTKLVSRLGERTPVPVEVVAFGWRRTAATLEQLGCRASRREFGGEPFVTDEGHYILDCRFGPIADPPALAARLKSLVGVVEHGLFIDLAQTAIVGTPGGVQVYQRASGDPAVKS